MASMFAGMVQSVAEMSASFGSGGVLVAFAVAVVVAVAANAVLSPRTC